MSRRNQYINTKRRTTVSGHSVSATHDKIIASSAGRGPAIATGHRQRAPETIADNTSDSIGRDSQQVGWRSTPGPAGNNWDAAKSAPTQDAPTPSVPARTLG